MAPNIKGSVGRLKPIPASESRRFTAKGVQKTINSNNLSNATNDKIIINNSTGNSENQKNSFAIKTLLSAINNALNPYSHFIFFDSSIIKDVYCKRISLSILDFFKFFSSLARHGNLKNSSVRFLDEKQ